MNRSLLLVPIAAVVFSACTLPGMKPSATPAPTPTALMEASPTTGQAGVMVGGAMMVPTRTLVENAMLANNVTTLVAAAQTAELLDELQGEGPFTIFAPTNEAFSKLPAGTVEDLLKPANRTKLTSVLTYHVVPGRYTAADLKDGMMLKTMQGETLKVTIQGNKVMVNGAAMVETADVISSNGVTHIIDTVLMPSK